MSDNPGGSCEPCKKRKRKCDRGLPTCGQCEGSQSDCKYAEGSKRGIPSGYISTLEQRLMETEGVLFCALSELRNLRSQPNVQLQTKLEPPTPSLLGARETNPNKALRMAEWKEYPLRTSEQITRWEEFFSSKDLRTRSHDRLEADTSNSSSIIPVPKGVSPSFQPDSLQGVNNVVYTQAPSPPHNLTYSVLSNEARNTVSHRSPLSNSGHIDYNPKDFAFGVSYDPDTTQNATSSSNVGDDTLGRTASGSTLGLELQTSIGTDRSQTLAAKYRNIYY